MGSSFAPDVHRLKIPIGRLHGDATERPAVPVEAERRIKLDPVALARNRLGDDPHHMEKSMREHVEIVSAIREKDLSRAANILVRHIARKEGSYWEHLDPDQASSFVSPARAD